MSVLELLYISCTPNIRDRRDIVGRMENWVTSVHTAFSALLIQLSSRSDRRITSSHLN
jgi:hypothetical protein